jgi:hypothetical protein
VSLVNIGGSWARPAWALARARLITYFFFEKKNKKWQKNIGKGQKLRPPFLSLSARPHRVTATTRLALVIARKASTTTTSTTPLANSHRVTAPTRLTLLFSGGEILRRIAETNFYYFSRF